MKVLALDTSSIVATAAILDNDKLICEYVINYKLTHSKKIMPIIKEITDSTQTEIKDIDILAVANGPGSFTGLRIGVATVKGLAHAINKPIVGISTLDGLAYNFPYCKYLICPIMDARRNQVYNGLYKWNNDNFCVLEKPRAICLDELITQLKQINKKVVFCGDGVKVYREKLIKELDELCVVAPPYCNMQKASSIAQLAFLKAQKGEVEDYMTFVPFYLRKSQAEREYDKNHKKA